MKTRILIPCAGLVLALVAGLLAARRATAAPEDDAALVRKKCNAIVTAWNKHDAKAIAANFAEDGDSIEPDGRHFLGRANVEKMFADDHGPKGMMRETTLEIRDEPIRFPTADVAVSDASVVLTGVIGPDGQKSADPVKVHVTNVWKKSGGEWWVYSCRPYMVMEPPPKPVMR